MVEAAINQLETAPTPDARTIYYNYHMDRRLSDTRKNRYRHGFAPDPADTLEEAVREHHRKHLARYVGFSDTFPDVPETFAVDINAPAIVPPPYGDQDLVRLETLDWIIDKSVSGLTSDELLKYLPDLGKPADKRSPAATAFFNKLIDEWNTKRDQRPMFAAFVDEVQGDIDSDQWLNRLRNRLGLGHITPYGGKKVTVALMQYSVEDVLAVTPTAERDRCFTVPTTVDGPLNPYFFPAPAAVRHGRALNLIADPACTRLTAEVLHRRINYAPKHLKKIVIARTVDDIAELVGRRNQHLECLRRQPGCADFGEVMG